ncbi:type I-F CRISPR-associated endoribonuclease Cas6/Csy4 [Polaromonas sp.]|uniref:type I-F CRISPR-associated endoribonuclease Cas6/Csy4 n=1 Tax=Polaromonas sp. TaxID=1869339 RepID=UPI0017D52634|nr:type I-F CRISPR-associated endoribonuclease Cas6/Csy4 [Polaromonas sp.]NML87275.1 type I-F CRISPR-associated endoribonuclease Cas6/Csy4 [Polaromonas sp.]
MDHYVDIDVRPDPEFPANQLMSALYARLHRALAAQASAGIGVSFPGFDSKAPHLGTRLRLHGSLKDLATLLAVDWLAGMRNHVALTPPTPNPPAAQHRRVSRVQIKSSPERLRRRLMRRHSLDEHEARQRIPDNAVRLTQLPFLQLRSTSTGQSFRLFIEHGPLQSSVQPGTFNAYGLSQKATIAWF